MTEIKQYTKWVNQQLFVILGYSNKTLSEYIVNIALKAKTINQLLKGLIANEVPDNDKTRLFSKELYERVHNNKSNIAPSNADLVRKSTEYTLVDMDTQMVMNEDVFDKTKTYSTLKSTSIFDDQEKSHKRDKKDKKASKKEKKNKSSASSTKRQERLVEEESEEEEDTREVRKRLEETRTRQSQIKETGTELEVTEDSTNSETYLQKKVNNDENDDVKDVKTQRMDQDIAERDAFTARLKAKDDAKTKTSSSSSSSSSSASSHDHSRGIDTNDKGAIDQLREISRQHYLEKREERELTLLKMEVEDEEYLFEHDELSAEEKRRLDVKKQILAMANSKEKLRLNQIDGYQLPESYEDEKGKLNKEKKEKALTGGRYVEEVSGGNDVDLWEAEQSRLGNASNVTKRLTGTNQANGNKEEYEILMEDQIQFISQSAIAGYDALTKKKQEVTTTTTTTTTTAVSNVKTLTIHEKKLEARKQLPVFAYREDFLRALQEHKVMVLVGETGSGKTTQIPQYLHEAGWSELGCIGCTQPRRVAAMSVAARVASEMNVKLGHEVGYSIRFEDCTSKSTVIKYMTDGMLLREFLNEPDLASYSCMVVDEAHERTLSTDVLFGLVKDISRFRGDDFRLIIMSATMDAEKFSSYFDDCPIFMIPGRMYPVDILYTKAPEADYLDAVVVTVLQIHVTQDVPGDILVFLTGQEEIETVAEILQQRTKGLGSRIRELMILPIFANLPSDQQARIFERPPVGGRKVVLGTNIAETSLTVDGICYVIDTGFCKQKSYNARRGMESLQVVPISKAAANQRAGRAGRTQPGKCFRLYTLWSFNNELEDTPVPEIQRTNMCDVVLKLKSLGIDDLLNFDFMDKPPAEALIRALEQLYALGALNDRGQLTKLGRRMAEFPLDPMMSKALICSETYNCSVEVLTIVSMLSVGSAIFYRPKDKALHADVAKRNFARGGGGDHLTLLRCYNEWMKTNYSQQWCRENFVQIRMMQRARDIREQLEGLCERVEVTVSSRPEAVEDICKALCSGYFFNTATLGKGGDYKTTKHKHTVYIHPSSVLAREMEIVKDKDGKEKSQYVPLVDPPQWLLYHELAFTSKEYMRAVAPIQSKWLVEIAPHYYKDSDIGEDDESKNKSRNKNKKARMTWKSAEN